MSSNEKIAYMPRAEELQDASPMETAPELPAEARGITRRELLGLAGLAAAVAVPVIASIMAPTPAHSRIDDWSQQTTVGQGDGSGSGVTCPDPCLSDPGQPLQNIKR